MGDQSIGGRSSLDDWLYQPARPAASARDCLQSYERWRCSGAQRSQQFVDLGEGRWQRPAGLSVFKSVGTAVQDLAAALAVATAAAKRGVGRDVELLSPKTF
jgi:hypothetical protein